MYVHTVHYVDFHESFPVVWDFVGSIKLLLTALPMMCLGPSPHSFQPMLIFPNIDLKNTINFNVRNQLKVCDYTYNYLTSQ